MIRWLEVKYPEYDYKSEYSMPILCRARDMGKVIYGKWIIGGSQYNAPADSVYPDDTEKFYTAYKLVDGAEIICNFELEDRNIPCVIFVRFTDSAVCRSPQEQEVGRLYYVDAAINSYHPCCGEPEIDATDNGMIYIKMPSGVETKSADGAAEEKSTDRPQILKGDIVRVVEKIADIPGAEWENRHFVSDVKWDGVFSDKLDFYYNTDIIAIYRFDGRDFKCIWQDEKAMERFAKETGKSND